MSQRKDCHDFEAELPAHLAAHQVQMPSPGDKNEPQNDMERLAGNVARTRTAPTGYVHHDCVEEEAQGSGYTHGWDQGFAQDGDPYGIQAEYLPQSANPDAALPTQEQADEIAAQPV